MEKLKKNARQRQNDFKVSAVTQVYCNIVCVDRVADGDFRDAKIMKKCYMVCFYLILGDFNAGLKETKMEEHNLSKISKYSI